MSTTCMSINQIVVRVEKVLIHLIDKEMRNMKIKFDSKFMFIK